MARSYGVQARAVVYPVRNAGSASSAQPAAQRDASPQVGATGGTVVPFDGTDVATGATGSAALYAVASRRVPGSLRSGGCAAEKKSLFDTLVGALAETKSVWLKNPKILRAAMLLSLLRVARSAPLYSSYALSFDPFRVGI